MKRFKSVIASILITLSFVLVIGIISTAAMMTVPDSEKYLSLISGAAQLVWLIGAVVILKLRKIGLSERCGIKKAPFGMFVLSAAAGFCFSVFSNLLQEISLFRKLLIGEAADVSGGNIIVFITAIFIIAPFTEEFLFRGLIMTRLRDNMKPFSAILISALLFGIIHLMTGSVITGIHALIGGLIFGLAYEKRLVVCGNYRSFSRKSRRIDSGIAAKRRSSGQAYSRSIVGNYLGGALFNYLQKKYRINLLTNSF